MFPVLALFPPPACPSEIQLNSGLGCVSNPHFQNFKQVRMSYANNNTYEKNTRAKVALLAVPVTTMSYSPNPNTSAPNLYAQRQTFFITNQLSGKCLDVAGAPGTSNGARLILWDCESNYNRDNGLPTDQRWMFDNSGFIRNALSGKCIDVSGAPGTSNGSQLILWDCESNYNRDNGLPTDQRWMFDNSGFIRNALSGKCIDVSGAPGTSNGSQLILWDCESNGYNRDNGSPTDQRWRLVYDSSNHI